MVRIRTIKLVLTTDDDRKHRVEFELGTNTRYPTGIEADTPEDAMKQLVAALAGSGVLVAQ